MTNNHRDQERRAAESLGLRPSDARACPRVVAGKRCLSYHRSCVCHTYYSILDHHRMWLDTEGRYVLTGEPYQVDDSDLSNFTEAMAELGLKVSVKDKSESFWYPGSTLLILITGEHGPSRKSPLTAEVAARVSWKTIEDTVRERWGGEPAHRNTRERGYLIPSPTGGHMTLEVTLRPRWCSLAVDRWRTTDRLEAPSKAWFEANVWPAVHKALKEKKTGAGFLPGGGGAFSSATPIDRSDLLDLLIAWVDAELTWGKPKEGRNPGSRP